jgi:hypothetical protein
MRKTKFYPSFFLSRYRYVHEYMYNDRVVTNINYLAILYVSMNWGHVLYSLYMLYFHVYGAWPI